MGPSLHPQLFVLVSLSSLEDLVYVSPTLLVSGHQEKDALLVVPLVAVDSRMIKM